MTVNEIKSSLTDLGYNENELKSLSKKELTDILDTHKSATSLLDSAVVNPINDESAEIASVEQIIDAQVVEEKSPIPTDIGWTDYVLGQMDQDKEIDKGNPRTDGLRRIAEKLMGGFNIKTKVVATPHIENAYRATVCVTLEFDTGRIYEGAADVFTGNTDKMFAKHAVATAETRAEGRALRKALKLTKVLAAEETYNADVDEPTGLESGGMPSGMLNGLNVMCGKLNVDLLKVAQKNGINVNSVNDLTKEHGMKISNLLGEYNRKAMEITDDIKK